MLRQEQQEGHTYNGKKKSIEIFMILDEKERFNSVNTVCYDLHKNGFRAKLFIFYIRKYMHVTRYKNTKTHWIHHIILSLPWAK